MTYQPDWIYLDEEVQALPHSQRILARLPQAKIHLAPAQEHKILIREAASLTQGKRILHLKAFKGNPLKLCPGYTDSVLCCNYHVIDLVENCPLECSYCILQAFLNKNVISLHVNVEEMLQGIAQTLAQHPHQIFRVGTGEHSDSLALDHLFGVNSTLVEAFARFPNAHLELKTKTAAVEPLLGLQHGGRTLIGWSVNPEAVIQTEEFKVASLRERLEAAQAVVQAGYKVSFHFDPLIHHPQWRENYQATVEQILAAVPPDKITWISLGTLRYIPSLKKIAEERFPKTRIFMDEFIPSEDGKMKYLKEIRQEMTGFVGKLIERLGQGRMPLYLCMEKKSIWEKNLAHIPQDAEDLDRYLCSNL